MKKIILLVVVTSMISCSGHNPDGSHKAGNSVLDIYFTVKVDSCEYIRFDRGLAHKGNCKYCAERRKQELKELIEELKKK